MRGPAPRTLVVAAEHVEILRHNLRTGKTEHRVAYRSRVILLRGSGLGPTEVASRVGCGRNTVWRVEERYRKRGIEALHDLPRPGRPRTISPPAENAGRGARLQKAG
jgi:hypothetical protein